MRGAGRPDAAWPTTNCGCYRMTPETRKERRALDALTAMQSGCWSASRKSSATELFS